MTKIFALTILMTGLLGAGANTEMQRYIGTATDLKSGKILYYEEHNAVYEGSRHLRSTITYRDPLQKVIAEKTIEMSGTSTVQFRLEDFRFGTVEGAEQTAEGIKLFERERLGAPYREKVLAIPPPIAIDAGLNELVRNHWHRLERGETVRFHLGVPSQLDYFEFRAVGAGEENVRGKAALVVRFESDHWFIRLFVDPVVVWYDRELRRAVNYEGISNIYDEEGKSYVVRVTFDKPGP